MGKEAAAPGDDGNEKKKRNEGKWGFSAKVPIELTADQWAAVLTCVRIAEEKATCTRTMF